MKKQPEHNRKNVPPQDTAKAPKSAVSRSMRTRAIVLAALFVLVGFGAVVYNLYQLQIVQHDELAARAGNFLRGLEEKYPRLASKIAKIADYMRASRIVVASHMHAGDGNCHVNIPVNSNDLHMLEIAEEAAMRVMAEAQEMGGAVSGEHGIGITKISFLDKSKMDALREFKARVDPRDILNPGKLVQRQLPVRPFTFSFNRLIEDIRQSGLPDKERFIRLLSTVQTCTRCGKCKQVCPMVYPERSYQYHPRNKNMVLGAITEAIYYAQVTKGKPDPSLLEELRQMVEHCTGCGPVKIESAEVALAMLAFLKEEGMGGHPIKSRVLNWLSHDPAGRVPRAAKAAALGQKVQNRVIGLVPRMWRERIESPRGRKWAWPTCTRGCAWTGAAFSCLPGWRTGASTRPCSTSPGAGAVCFTAASPWPPWPCSCARACPWWCPASTCAAAILCFPPGRTAITAKIWNATAPIWPNI